MSQAPVLAVMSYIARESQEMAPKIVHRQPQGREIHQSLHRREIQTISQRNVDNFLWLVLTAITWVLQTSRQFGKNTQKSQIKLAQDGPLVPQKLYGLQI